MAAYNELATIQTQAAYGALIEKIRVAVVIKAVALIKSATPTAKELAWAFAALDNPARTAESVTWYVIGDNAGATITQILGAGDAAVQTNVDAAVAKLVAGGV